MVTAAVAAPKVAEEDLAANYGFALATLNSNPELKKTFKNAVKGQWTPERFIAQLKGTKWWQQRSLTQSKYDILKTSHPQQYVSQVEQTMASIADQWGEMTGEQLTFNAPTVAVSGGGAGKKGKKKKDAKGKTVTSSVSGGAGTLFQLADQALRNGWNESQIRDHLAASVDWRARVRTHTISGASSAQLSQWRNAAADLGVQPHDDWFADRLGDVNKGSQTAEGVIDKLRQQAKQRYAAFADDIDNGATLKDLTENYRQSIGNILEVPPNQVDVFDKNIQRAITARNTDGLNTPMNIGDFEDTLRKDDRWQFTQNAHDKIVGLGTNVVRSFGLMA